MVNVTNRHLRSGPVCGMQMMMKDSKAQIISGSMMLQSSMNKNTDMATSDSNGGFAGLVSST